MSHSDDAWNDVGEQFKKLGSTFKRHYQSSEGSTEVDPPSDEEVKDALRTLGDSVKQAFSAVGDAFTDPEIKEDSRQAAGLFFDALGATFTGLGEDISKHGEAAPDASDPDSTEPSDAPAEPEAP